MARLRSLFELGNGYLPPQKLTCSPLKLGLSKRKPDRRTQPSIFRGELAVSFTECTKPAPETAVSFRKMFFALIYGQSVVTTVYADDFWCAFYERVLCFGGRVGTGRRNVEEVWV